MASGTLIRVASSSFKNPELSISDLSRSRPETQQEKAETLSKGVGTKWIEIAPPMALRRARSVGCLKLGGDKVARTEGSRGPRSHSLSGCFSCVRSSSRSQNASPGLHDRAPVDTVSNSEEGADGHPAGPVPEHLLITVNGIVGSENDWKFAADQFKLRLGGTVMVYCSVCNAANKTFDGVDVMGQRLAEEVKGVVKTLPGLKKISFLAHSLGGLIARYAIGQLYAPSSTILLQERFDGDQSAREKIGIGQLHGTIAGLEPINFITVATPHLGSRGNRQLPFLFGVSLLEKVAISIAHWFVGRTGRHLFLTDNNKSQLPLLQRMVTDCNEGQFISALKAFKCRIAYANVSYDHMVGWRTASFRRECELPEVNNIPINDKYPHVVRVEDLAFEADEIRMNNKPASDPIEEEMIAGLRQLSWRRVDVNFHGSAQRFAAHNTIQVKQYKSHSEGADVIAHIIDNF